jgi:hypothetical protein
VLLSDNREELECYHAAGDDIGYRLVWVYGSMPAKLTEIMSIPVVGQRGEFEAEQEGGGVVIREGLVKPRASPAEQGVELLGLLYC